MTGLHHAIWLPLSVFFYAMVMLYWVRVSIAGNRGADGFFSASHGLPPWLGALVTAGVSLTGWFVLGGTQLVARDGFTLPVLVSAGVLLALPGVADCAVFGLPDDMWGERVSVLIVRDSAQGDLTEGAVEAHCRERLAGFKIPRTILFDDNPLPRTPTGKVQKFLLVERFASSR